MQSDSESRSLDGSAPYAQRPAMAAQVQKGADRWTLILTRELRHSPEKVWLALTDPAHLRQWAPFEADGNLAAAGATVNLTWVGTGNVVEVPVKRADAPRALELGDMRWELEPLGHGTRLRLWHSIPPRFVAWGAAGWHIAFDVLAQLLAGEPTARMAGPEAMKHGTWQRLVAEYTKQFAAETPE